MRLISTKRKSTSEMDGLTTYRAFLIKYTIIIATKYGNKVKIEVKMYSIKISKPQRR